MMSFNAKYYHLEWLAGMTGLTGCASGEGEGEHSYLAGSGHHGQSHSLGGEGEGEGEGENEGEGADQLSALSSAVEQEQASEVVDTAYAELLNAISVSEAAVDSSTLTPGVQLQRVVALLRGVMLIR